MIGGGTPILGNLHINFDNDQEMKMIVILLRMIVIRNNENTVHNDDHNHHIHENPKKLLDWQPGQFDDWQWPVAR